MFGLEFIKLFKRKLNYFLFILFSVVFAASMYKMEYLKEFFGFSNEEFFGSYYLRVLLIISMIIISLNIVYAYRFDYKNKINTLIKFSKVSSFKNIFSKLMSAYIFTLFNYGAYLGVGLVYLYVKNNSFFFELIKERSFYYSLGMSLSILFFVANLVLLLVVIFNSSNLTLSILLLFLAGNAYLLEYLTSIWGDFSKYDIITKGFSNISYYTDNYFYSLVFFAIAVLILLLTSIFKKLAK